jgi:cytoskeleton protein RodZ
LNAAAATRIRVLGAGLASSHIDDVRREADGLEAMFTPPNASTPHDGNDTPPVRPASRPAAVAPALEPGMRAGSKLRAAREALGYSLEQVAAKTRIRPEYIAALETMNVNHIPGKAYAKAYLRSYVKFLGLTEDEIVIQYENESARLREDAGEQIHNPASKPAPERPWFWAAVLGVVCAGFIGWRAMHDGEVAPEPKIVAERKVETPAPAPQPAPPVREDDGWGLPSQVVEIRAKTPAWLEVRGADGTIFFSRNMAAGEIYKPDVGANWTLHAKDGGAFEVVLNGALVGLLGDLGAPVLGRQVDKIASAPPVPAPAGEG